MTYRVGKKFQFSASHQIEGLPADHKCSRLHGHTYEVEVEVARDTLGFVGFVVDYAEISRSFEPVLAELDHRHLNDVLEATSAESIADWIFHRLWPVLPGIAAVRVSESPSTWAEFRP